MTWESILALLPNHMHWVSILNQRLICQQEEKQWNITPHAHENGTATTVLCMFPHGEYLLDCWQYGSRFDQQQEGISIKCLPVNRPPFTMENCFYQRKGKRSFLDFCNQGKLSSIFPTYLHMIRPGKRRGQVFDWLSLTLVLSTRQLLLITILAF